MSRRRSLTPDEEALWRKVMRDVSPMRKKRPAAEKIVSGPQAKVVAPGVSPPRRHALAQESRVLPKRTEHPFAAGDPRLEKRAARGRLPVDAVLDLHGHSQRTAQMTLLRFVTQAHANGARCVLVITGKGAPALSEHVHGAVAGGAGRGVLRAKFADWLEEEPLRRLVSRASPAHQRHGGAGAFYIFLKR